MYCEEIEIGIEIEEKSVKSEAEMRTKVTCYRKNAISTSPLVTRRDRVSGIPYESMAS